MKKTVIRKPCVKCGKGPIHTLYKGETTRYGQTIQRGEHLRRFCGHCWYEWPEHCVDHVVRRNHSVKIKEEIGISPDSSLIKGEKENKGETNEN